MKSLDSRVRPPSEESLALQRAVGTPQALLTGSEAAALELFTQTKQRAVVRSALATLKSAQVLLGKQEDLSVRVIEVYLRAITTEGRALSEAQAHDLRGLCPWLLRGRSAWRLRRPPTRQGGERDVRSPTWSRRATSRDRARAPDWKVGASSCPPLGAARGGGAGRYGVSLSEGCAE